MKNIILILSILALAACSSEEKVNDTSSAGKADEMSERIRTMEDSLFKHMAFDRRSAQMLMDVYKAYVAAYPLDERSPEYLFRAAGVARSMKDPQQSIRLYDRIEIDYPSWSRMPDTYYMRAFTIDTELDQKGEAKKAYQKVINHFPEHPFAADAKLAIENLQYTDAELIERFQRMQAEQEAASADR